MMQHRAVQVAMWVFSRLMPRKQREAAMGDLAEEYALRSHGVSSPAAFKWFLRQVCASAPPLLWARLTGAVWISTLGVALFAYCAVGVVEFIVNWATAGWLATSSAAYNPLGMFITFPAVVLIGYFASRFRRRAAFVLGAIMLLSVTAMTVWSTETMPRWYRIAYFLVGPAAACIGSVMHSLRRARS